MADLFLSYKSEDRSRITSLLEALQSDGITVWWDAQIEGGAGWRHRIETELVAAKCVLVVWSRHSVGPEGEFVHEEATRAKRRHVYLPVLIDPVEPPLGFGEMQALPLIGWKGDRADSRYRDVLGAVRSVIAGVRPAAPTEATATRGPAVGRRLAIGGGLLLGAMAAVRGGYWLMERGRVATSDSIAVLPFANLSGDPRQAYFSEGIAEELRSALARIAGLKVAARTSSEKVRDDDIKDAARKLGVAHMLTGSVRKGGETVRVTAQLIDGRSGLQIWSERYDRVPTDVLSVQTGIAESVANRLSLTLGKAAAMLGGTKNAAAYDAYLRGLGSVATDAASYRTSIAAFDAAIAEDPGFAAAHANRAWLLATLADFLSPTLAAGMLKQADAASARALALEPTLPIAHDARGIIGEARLDFRGADAAFARLLSLPDVGSRELADAAVFQSRMGRADKAAALLDRAIALDPLNPSTFRDRIFTLFASRQFAAALAAIAMYNTLHPADKYDPEVHALVLLFNGEPKAAVEVAAGSEPFSQAYISAIAYAKLGNMAASDRALAAMRTLDTGVVAYQFACVHSMRGEADYAFEQLEQAVAKGDQGLAQMRTDPALDPLRADTRFAAIETRLNFPPR